MDTQAPQLNNVSVPADGYYQTGSTLIFQASFSEPVTVVTAGGTPRIGLTVGGQTRYAVYAGGTGTNLLLFSYAIQAGDEDKDGIAFLNPAAGLMDMNGAVVRDGANNNAVVTGFPVPDVSGIKIDTNPPAIVSAAVNPGTYLAGSKLSFALTFTEPVTVTGTPKLSFTIGTDPFQADYISGSGTNKLIWEFALPSGLLDENGIQLAGSLLSGGAITDEAGNAALYSLPEPLDLADVKVDTIIPRIVSVTADPAAGGYYRAGDSLSFSVTFDRNVTVSGGAGDEPKLPFQLGLNHQSAHYVSGSGSSVLTFAYTVAAGDGNGETADLSDSNALLPGGAAIQSASGNPASLSLAGTGLLSNVKVDSTAPSITGIQLPVKTYAAGDTLVITLQASENVQVTGQPSLPLFIGVNGEAGTERLAAYDTAASSANELVFRYAIAAGDLDTDGISYGALALNGAVITDEAGNPLAGPLPAADWSSIQVDTINPVVKQLDIQDSSGAPAAGPYKAGEQLQFTLPLSKTVNVDLAGGTPSLTLQFDGKTSSAAYAGGSGSLSQLVFAYTVAAGDNTDGLSVLAIELNGSSAKDAAGNPLILTVPGGGTTAVKLDTTPPAAPVFTLPDGAKLSYDAVILSGTAEAGATVEVINGTDTGTTTAASDGRWSVSFTGLAEGTAAFTATAVDEAGNRSGTSAITAVVSPKLAFGHTSYSLREGETGDLTVQALHADGTADDVTGAVTFSTGDSTIAAVESAKLKGVSPGTTLVTALWQGLSATADVTVTRSAGGSGGTTASYKLSVTVDGKPVQLTIAAQDIVSGLITLNLNGQSSASLTLSRQLLDEWLGINGGLVVDMKLAAGSVQLKLRDLLEQAAASAGSPQMVQGLSLSMAQADPSQISSAQQALIRSGAEAISAPVWYKAGYTDEAGSQYSLAGLTGYMKRTFAIGSAKPLYGSTVVRWDAAAGAFQFVPAVFKQVGGIWTAELKDLGTGLYIAVSHPVSFADTAQHWADSDISLLASMFVVNGDTQGKFNPNASITRAEFAALITRVLGLEGGSFGSSSSFTDVQDASWYANAIRAAAAAGIITGYEDGGFHPNAAVSRQEMAVMLLRAIHFAGADASSGTSAVTFHDGTHIAGWAAESVAQAAQLGLIKGDSSGAFRPSDHATRAESAAMLLRLMRYAGLSPW
ncbi:S-layer homology domain-containing protein [Paenibacillus protaetiae]|uniref:S-layer homology domain-containing protein n=1 Tax=Paenibacillus protaetiae TaxID=2509456 RepID=A0A4P6EXV4_9BACL|nr:S-layer homology domain-containing protein [Paenibacillus protaetiae]QAY67083.1 S-layer homology domain-containing protein [Paenibacillus protaetiae]